MKNYTTSQIAEFNYTVEFASALPSGYGHKEITATLIAENGDKKEFKSVTSNMPDYDEAMDLEGQEKYEALFDLVEYNIDEEIAEWLYSLDNN